MECEIAYYCIISKKPRECPNSSDIIKAHRPISYWNQVSGISTFLCWLMLMFNIVALGTSYSHTPKKSILYNIFLLKELLNALQKIAFYIEQMLNNDKHEITDNNGKPFIV